MPFGPTGGSAKFSRPFRGIVVGGGVELLGKRGGNLEDEEEEEEASSKWGAKRQGLKNINFLSKPKGRYA